MTLATELGGPSTVTIDAVTYKAIGYGVGFYWQTFGAREARFSYDKAQCKDDGLNRRSNGISIDANDLGSYNPVYANERHSKIAFVVKDYRDGLWLWPGGAPLTARMMTRAIERVNA